MITVGVLSKKYDNIDWNPYGPVVVIPKQFFLEAWRIDLGLQGHKCVEFMWKGKPVIFVLKRIDPEVQEEYQIKAHAVIAKEKVEKDQLLTTDGKVVRAAPAGPEPSTPQPKRKYHKRQNKTSTRLYTPQMEKRLIELYNSDATYTQMADTMNKEFPQKAFTERNLSLKVSCLRKDIRTGKLQGVTLKRRQKGKHVTPVKQLPESAAIEITRVSMSYETADGYVASVSGPTLKGCCLLLRILIEAAENVQ